MSDFLSNLAATALHVAPIAQPRTPAVFEPRTIDDGVPPLERVESVTTSPVVTPRTETREQLNTPMLSESNHAMDSVARIEEKTLRSELQPATITTPSITPRVPRPAPVPLHGLEPSGQEEQSGRAETTHSMVEETSTVVSTSPLAPRSSSVEMVHPRIERQSNEERFAAEAIEPRIHISIGRIEVRAATSSAPTRAAKREASILGLDDYLRQRR